jgi:hypothetical protein
MAITCRTLETVLLDGLEDSIDDRSRRFADYERRKRSVNRARPMGQSERNQMHPPAADREHRARERMITFKEGGEGLGSPAEGSHQVSQRRLRENFVIVTCVIVYLVVDRGKALRRPCDSFGRVPSGLLVTPGR